MQEQFLQKIFKFIQQQELIAEGDLVYAGVSGGADSMCLLQVLCAYRQQVDFELRVIHVEHGIRGEDSLADAAYVSRFCEERRIFCEVIPVDVSSYSVAHKSSIEEAARVLRYEAFEAAAQKAEDMRIKGEALLAGKDAVKNDGTCRVKIAVAHHMEDQAETVLWQMIRGSDVRGMGGMRPARGRIIRPLLTVGRSQIETFLREEGICWREDATNSDRTYTRNRLRMDVLPVLMQLNGQAIAHLCESAGRLQETEDYLMAQTGVLYERHAEKAPQGGVLVRMSLLQEHPLMQRRVLYRALQTVSERAKDLGARHIELLRELFLHQVGRELVFPHGVLAVRTYEGVELLTGSVQDAWQAGDETLPERIHMEVLERVPISEISKKKYTKWFDYDKIQYSVQIRRRESGDYLVVDQAGHRQKLKNYLVNEKIPKTARDNLWLLADGSHVMWVIGHRISDYYKVDEHTKRVLKVQLSGGKEDE